MKTTFEFISTKDSLPPVSGMYLVINKSGTHITTLEFSARHQSFNASDTTDDNSFAIEASYWAHIPEELKDAMSKTWEEYKNEN